MRKTDRQAALKALSNVELSSKLILDINIPGNENADQIAKAGGRPKPRLSENVNSSLRHLYSYIQHRQRNPKEHFGLLNGLEASRKLWHGENQIS